MKIEQRNLGLGGFGELQSEIDCNTGGSGPPLRTADRDHMSATIGRTEFEVDDGLGVLVRTESRDYLILAEHLVLDGQPALPQRGDRVRETDGSQTVVYEVMAPGKEPPWRYSDPYRKTLRIHTKQVDTEEA